MDTMRDSQMLTVSSQMLLEAQRHLRWLTDVMGSSQPMFVNDLQQQLLHRKGD